MSSAVHETINTSTSSTFSSCGKYLCTRDVLKSWLSYELSSLSFSLGLSTDIYISIYPLHNFSTSRSFACWLMTQTSVKEVHNDDVEKNYLLTGQCGKNTLLNDFFTFFFNFYYFSLFLVQLSQLKRQTKFIVFCWKIVHV